MTRIEPQAHGFSMGCAAPAPAPGDHFCSSGHRVAAPALVTAIEDVRDGCDDAGDLATWRFVVSIEHGDSSAQPSAIPQLVEIVHL
jgi:hypothetical protein